ncbi:ElyC/SanA/YdcF family protein [Cronobacter muytjensii]|uniref:SanA/YdcF family protein n=1 Tax=Cronobacter muytjensii TaxID=413501 RepID=UPI0029FD28F3|nr:ElyC/SanA/YdcF family protein [Cronobacter muytjensii]EKS1845796.1 YdcF family protein [Cronobacter muytjensii]ELY6275762.1 YdcF family protein [Cronobacter muytjensii]MEB8641738.1 ElyC/SanA/YdcF family protein [Cronobacter muytjensii]
MTIPSRWKRFFAVAALLAFTGALLSVIAIIAADRTVTRAADGRLYEAVANTPARKVGLVLGARPDNRFFNRRIEAAAALYHAGKVSWLLVSGDNSRADYDEPTAMAEALNRRGVPATAIFCDYAGFSTLDSVVRAREVFQETRITIISQAFHNARAVYLAQHYGIDAIGFNAEDPALRHTQYTLLRERFARVRAVLDARWLRREPHFLGPKVAIGPNDAPRGCNIYAATP